MRKLLVLFSFLLVCATAGFAQSDSNWKFFDRSVQASNRDLSTPRLDLLSPRIPYNGISTEVVANLHGNVGLVAKFSATFDNTTFVDSLSGRRFNPRVSRYPLVSEPSLNWRNSSPFISDADAVFGAVRYDADRRDGNFTSSDTNINAFALAPGEGLKISGGNHIEIRAGQLNYLPVFSSRKREAGLLFTAREKSKQVPYPRAQANSSLYLSFNF